MNMYIAQSKGGTFEVVKNLRASIRFRRSATFGVELLRTQHGPQPRATTRSSSTRPAWATPAGSWLP